MIACGASRLCCSVAALVVLPPETRRARSTTPALPTILRACRSGQGAWAAAIVVITSFVLGLIEVVAPLDLDARLGLSASVIGLLFAASIAVDAVFAPFGGRWGDRSGRAYPAFVGLLGTALSAVLLAVLPGVVGTIVALAVYGAGFSLAISAAVPWLDEAFDERERGLAYGVQNLLYAGGYAIGPLLGGALLGASGADLAYGVSAIVVAAAAVGLWFAWPAEEKTATSVQPGDPVPLGDLPWLDEAFDEGERGLAYGVQNLLYAGGYAIGPLVGGALLAASGADLAYAVCAIVVAAAAVGLWFRWPAEEKTGDEATSPSGACLEPGDPVPLRDLRVGLGPDRPAASAAARSRKKPSRPAGVTIARIRPCRGTTRRCECGTPRGPNTAPPGPTRCSWSPTRKTCSPSST